MLDSFENRKGYMMAFGLAANSIVSVIFGANEELLGEELNGLVEKEISKMPFLSGKHQILLPPKALQNMLRFKIYEQHCSIFSSE